MNEINQTNEEKIPENNMVTEKTKTTDGKPDTSVVFKVISIFSIIGVIVLFFLVLKKDKSGNSEPLKTVSNATFAFVNTDTINSQYDFVSDIADELATYDESLESQYKSSVASFKKEYDDYIKKASAGLLSLEQQKKSEEVLGAKQQAIAEMESQLSAQSQEAKVKKNMEVLDTVINFVKRYNKTKNYTFIFQQAYGGNLLFANEALDITADIVKGLNEEYHKRNGNKETKKDEKK